MFVLLVLLLNGHVEVKKTEIFSTILRHNFCVANDFSVYVADTRSSHIVRFGPDGKRLGEFGGRGDGPGTFQFLKNIACQDSRIYAFDLLRKQVVMFSTDGDFRGAFKVPKNALDFVEPAQKINSGWVFRDPEGKSILMVDDHFGKPIPLIGNVVEDIFESDHKKSDYYHQKDKTYNPAPDRLHFSLNYSRDKVFVYYPVEVAQIKVFDLETGTLFNTIKLEIEKTPFPLAWGEKRFDQMVERKKNSKYSAGSNYKPEFPKYLPAVIALHTDWEGNVWVIPGTQYVKKDVDPLVFEPDGNFVKTPYSIKTINRVLATTDEWAFVSLYDDDEFGYVRIPRAELKTFLTGL